MDLMECVVDIALVGLVSLTVIGFIAMTVMAAKAAKDGSHGCGPVVVEEEDLSHLWEMGTCRYCRKYKECYTPDQQCAGCLWSDEYGPGF
jgi:hypothetical protein